MKIINKLKVKNGFTLLEVLIALSVLSISMLGIYSLINMSLDTASYTKNKMFVIEKGYERISKQLAFPTKVYSDQEEYDDIIVKYKFERSSTPIPTVSQIRMIVSTDKAEVEYIYYEQSGKI